MTFSVFNRIKYLTITLILFLVINLLFQLTSDEVIARSDGPEPQPDPEQEPDQPSTTATLIPEQDKQYELSKIGDGLSFNFNLTNEGNFPETFHLEVGAEVGGEIEFSDSRDSSVTLGKNDIEPIQVEIILPELSEGYFKFYINVTSKNTVPFQKFIHAIISHQEIIVTGRTKPVLIVSPLIPRLGTVSPGEELEVVLRVKCYVVSVKGAFLEYQLRKILDLERLPEKYLIVSSEPEIANEIKKGESQIFTLRFELPDNIDEKLNYTCQLTVKAKAYGYDSISPPVILNFLVLNEPKRSSSRINILTNPITMVGVSTVLIIGILGAVIGSSETSKYWLFAVLFIPLYTKLHKEKILDHFTRGRVYEHIRNNPGVHYSEIKRELELNNGSLAYHLHTLEREELIRSRTSGRFKLFFPTDVKIPKDMEPQVSAIRRQILNLIRNQPGITQKELASKLTNKKPRTISYHVKNMSREGVLRLEKAGREIKCYITDEVVEIKQNSVIFKEVDEEDSANQYSDGMIRQI